MESVGYVELFLPEDIGVLAIFGKVSLDSRFSLDALKGFEVLKSQDELAIAAERGV